jgi:hypothetical protein
MCAITEIIWPLYRRDQLYDQDIPKEKIDFGETCVRQIDATTVQFPAKFSCETAERQMLTVNFMLEIGDAQYIKCTVCTPLVNLMGAKLFAPGKAYVALSRVRSLIELRMEEPDCGKLINKNTANTVQISSKNHN